MQGRIAVVIRGLQIADADVDVGRCDCVLEPPVERRLLRPELIDRRRTAVDRAERRSRTARRADRVVGRVVDVLTEVDLERKRVEPICARDHDRRVESAAARAVAGAALVGFAG